ncbi:MAG: hypothetical protein Q9172_001892 [Xanthocarpia lactea]
MLDTLNHHLDRHSAPQPLDPTSPDNSRLFIASQALKPPAGFREPGESCEIPPVCNPDEESCKYCLAKGIYCRAPIQTMNLFDIRSFDESIHAFLSSQPIATSGNLSERPSTCLLNISWHAVAVGHSPISLGIHKSSCYMDVKGLFEHHNPPSPYPQLDPILDDHKQATANVDRTIEERAVDNLQIVGEWSQKQGQLFPSEGSRGKFGSTTVFVYRDILAGLARKVFTIWNLASDPPRLISQLEVLGKGIEPKSFNAARHIAPTKVAVINISTIHAEQGFESSMITESTFFDILAQKPYADNSSQSPRGHDAFRQLTSPLSPRQPPRRDSSVNSSKNVIPSADSEPFDFFSANGILNPELFDFFSADGIPDPVNGSPQELSDVNASLERERKLLGEQEQKVRSLEEKKFMIQISLGHAEPPAHMGCKNIFDEMQSEKQDKSGSPGAMTLVESEPDLVPEPQVLAATSKQPISGMSDMPLVHDHPDSEIIRMEDTMSERGIEADGSTVTGDKKRKRFSFFSATKKARTSTHASYENMPDGLDPSINRVDVRRPLDTSDSQKHSLVHFADADKPTISTRPTSWPRSRLFRRSAGIPVKKITEAFEKMRLQHERSSPTAS